MQAGNIKLTSYLSNIFGVTGQKLLNLFINGEVITIKRVKECMHGNLRATPKQLFESLKGKLTNSDRKLLEINLSNYNHYIGIINDLEKEIDNYIKLWFPEEHKILMSIPGISKHGSAIILGEIGPDLEVFPSAKHLASWIGICPGLNESAGYNRSGKTRKGNKYAKQVFVSAGGLAGQSNDMAFNRFRSRVIKNTGNVMKANVACGHKLVRIVYKLLKSKEFYDEEKALGNVYPPSAAPSL